MAFSLPKLLTSRNSKRIILVCLALLAFFLALNDVVLPWYVNSGGIVEVPQVVGLTFEAAQEQLKGAGLEPRKGDVRMDREHPAGTVVLQNPVDGARVKKGRRVYLTLSGGEILVAVPGIKGRTLRDAKYALEREGLRLGGIEYRPSDQYPPNTIVDQSIAPAAMVKHDTYVSVVVSQGNVTEKIAVPDLYGKDLPLVQKILADVGLRVGNITTVPSPDLLPNTIIQQFPRAGELVNTGQPVDLIVVQAGDKKKELFEN